MFSLKIKYAIQVLSEMRRFHDRDVYPSVYRLRLRCGFEKGGSQMQVMAQLRRVGWVDYENYRYRIIVDFSQKTLYDLMVSMDEELRIGPSPAIDWPLKSRSLCDPAIVLERELQAAFERQLKEYAIAGLTGVAVTTASKPEDMAVIEGHRVKSYSILVNGGMNPNEKNN